MVSELKKFEKIQRLQQSSLQAQVVETYNLKLLAGERKTDLNQMDY
jgi:hypothetical protein